MRKGGAALSRNRIAPPAWHERALIRATEFALVLAVGTLIAAPSAIGAAGDLDESFAGDGIVRVPNSVRALIAQPDGATVVAVAKDGPAGQPLRLLRYTPTGALDATFGSDGMVDPFPGRLAAQTIPVSLAEGPDGSVYIATATATAPGEHEWLIARFLASGEPDTAFGGAGRAVLPIQSNPLTSVVGGAAGPIYAVGENHVVSLNGDGSLNGSFSQDGEQELSELRASAAALEDTGSILVAGALREAGPPPEYLNLGVSVLQPSGQPDLDFGESGTARFRGVSTEPDSVAIDANGRVTVGLSGCIPQLGPGGPESCQSVVERFAADGQLEDPFGDELSIGSATATDAEGHFLVGGSRSPGRGFATAGAVERFGPDGLIDRAYGFDGAAYAYDRLRGEHLDYLDVGSDQTVLAAGGRQLIRFEGDGPLNDLDADGIEDPADRCELLHSRTRRGCPRIPRSVRLQQVGPTRFKVYFETPMPACETRQRIRLRREARGRDEAVSVERSNRQGDAVRFRVFEKGRYYAVAGQDFQRAVGLCRRAASKPRRLR